MAIRILDEKTYNQIAAGEVIERPSAIIRELIDNSLDANSNEIDIILTVGDGDFELEVRDNGEGINKIDLPLSIKKHATSKIVEFNEIYSLSTRGFRGEALSAIASVSYLDIVSSTQDDGTAYKMKTKAMEIEDIVSCMRSKGTTMKINRIFFNTPVRQKFLKSIVGEKASIKKEIINKILSSNKVGFSYSIVEEDKKKELINIPQSFSLKDKIYYLFGKKIADNLIEIKGQYGKETSRIWIEGYISNQTHRAKTRKNQYFFLFGRSIENATISKAFNMAYMNILPGKIIPVCFLNIDMNRSEVDINVHPTKKDVQFEHSDDMYRAVYHIIKKAIYEFIYTSKRSEVMAMNNNPFDDEDDLSNMEMKETTSFYNIDNEHEVNTNKDNIIELDEMSYSIDNGRGQNEENEENEESKNNVTEQNMIDTTRHTKEVMPNFIIHGQLAKNYILYSSGVDLFIIDQHAAHERMNFEMIKNNIENNKEYQYLLVPIVIDFSLSDIDKVNEVQNNMKQIGIKYEMFGETSIKMDKVPEFIGKESPKLSRAEVIKEIIEVVIENPNIQRVELVEKMISTIACRMSIMSGDELTLSEMKDIINELYKKDYIFNCPHGRPFVKKIQLKEIENFFER